MKKKYRLSILTSDDYTWAFDVWKRTIPKLQLNYRVTAINMVEDRLGPFTGWRISWWYLKTFGISNTLKLTLFSVKKNLMFKFSKTRTWKELSSKYGIKLFRFRNPNSAQAVEEITNQHPDIILIMVGQVLKPPIIKIAKLGIVNKHGGILPSCRGLFPFFWGRINHLPVGVSFHLVNEKIDAGKLLTQKEIKSNSISMLGFYRLIYQQFPSLVDKALINLIEKKRLNPRSYLKSSYFGLPTRKDVKEFEGLGYSIAYWRDILL